MMRQFIPKVLLCASIVAGGIRIASAREGALYQPAKAAGSAALKAAYGSCRLVQQDIPALLSHVQAGYAAQRGGAARPMQITVPFPDGRDVKFTVRDAEILSPGLAAENPDLHAMKGVSEDGYFRLRLTTSTRGMEAMISGRGGEQFYASPISTETGANLLVYDAKQMKGLNPLQCGAKELQEALKGDGAKLFKTTHGDGLIRTYRLAIAATGEYTTWIGSQANAVAGLTAIGNGVTEVFEKELGIHFTLVIQNSIIFTNATTDPYSTGDVDGTTLGDNQLVLDNTTYLGPTLYDVGMVITAKGSGGLAATPAACNASSKGQSASGLNPVSFPTGPSGFQFILTVAHETAHQFNATHSFAANTGGCAGNTNGLTGWEPGGGSTIMAYTNTCTGLSYQAGNDAHFHTGNLEQMSAYMTSTSGNCAATVTNSNTAPTASVSGGTSFTIPVSTPFRLTGLGSQTENDNLTYTFDQADPIGGTGTGATPAATNTTGPMFRPYPPSSSRTQYFPSLPVLLGTAGTTASQYEVLPSVARTLNFKYTVRDNRGYTATTAGRTANGSAVVNTVSCATPFAVTSQNTTGTLAANGTSTMTVSWSTPASTCVTCNNVNIRLSRDGGRSFPYILLASTPNDGTETFTVPNITTNLGRIMVECVDNVHFNINSAAQTITSTCVAEGTSFTPTNDLYAATATAASLNQTLTPVYGTQIGTPVNGMIESTDPSSSLAVNNGTNTGCQNYGANITRYDAYSFVTGTNGAYTFTNTAASSSDLVYNIYEGSYNTSAPCQNFVASSSDGSTLGTSVTATLSRNKTYVLVVGSYAANSPALPSSYSISVTGGNIYTNTPDPGAGFSYSYVIVSNGTNNIVAVRGDGNMTGYAAGTYSVWGLSSSSTAAALNTTYAGTSFAAFRTAVLNQTNGMCAAMSSNSRRVAIVTPTPTTLLSFDGRLTGRRSALLFWEAGNEEATRAFDVERSYDGKAFEYAGRVMPSRTLGGAYSLTDAGISQTAEAVYYRLKIAELSGEAKYSGVVKLKLDVTLTADVFNVSPNPVQQGTLRTTVSAGTAGIYSVTVIDLAGRKLLTQSLSLQAGENVVTLPVNALAPSLYLIELRGDNTAVTQRFVKP